MPLFESITISPFDLQQIYDALRALKHTGDVKIIDTGITFVLRDSSDFFLTEIKKLAA